MPGFYKHTEAATEWHSCSRIECASMEMNFAETDELVAIAISAAISDIEAEGCKDCKYEILLCQIMHGSSYFYVRAYGKTDLARWAF